jgi:hypothetical protein
MRLPASVTRPAHGLLFSAALALVSLRAPALAAEPTRSPITVAAEEAFWWGDFATIEQQNTDFRQAASRFGPDGRSRLDLFREGLYSVFYNEVENTEAYLKNMDALTLEWATEHPDSPLAHILHAKALVVHGWSYRGGGYVKDVPPEAWKEFHAYLKRAADHLKDHADVALKDSYAHLVLLEIGRGLGWSNEQMVAIADDGLKLDPEDLDLYFKVMESMLPKWGGNARVVDTYIKYATEKTRAKHGMELYARLYSAAADYEYRNTLFENSLADWSKIKQGYEDILARHPDSTIRRNRYAYLACVAKDRDTLLKVLAQLGTKIDISQWGSNPERSLEGCRRRAAEQ